MRNSVVIVGVSAIGGVVGGLLAEAGTDVHFVARNRRLEMLRTEGLRLTTPEGERQMTVSVVGHPGELTWKGDEIVLLTVESYDTVAVLDAMSLVVPQSAAVVCMQDGVRNEPLAAERFARVYGAMVLCPSDHAVPGRVTAYAGPTPGLIDIGRYDGGCDVTATEIRRVLARAGFSAKVSHAIMARKRRRLLLDLPNGLHALCGPAVQATDLPARAMAEGEAAMRAAGWSIVSQKAWDARMAAMPPIATAGGDTITGDGETADGPMTWQHLARQRATTEIDHLNGEIVRLGALTGVATPVNAMVCRRMHQLSARGGPPGSETVDSLLEAVA